MRTGRGTQDSGHSDARDAAAWIADKPGRRSLRALHAALREITERLACELGNPTATPPQWSPTDWALARAVAAIHGVSPLLADSLRWAGPAQWRSFLLEQRAHTAARFQRIQGLLHEIDDSGRRDGIALLPLKGAALHAQGIYAAGQRPMSDLDLLVEEAQLERTAAALARLGFRETHRTWKHRVYRRDGEPESAALGEYTANGINIELHPWIREVLPVRAVNISAAVWPPDPRPGLNPYPSKAALFMHLVLHAAGAAVMRELRLLHLHDIARLSERMDESDWDEVLRQSACMDAGGLWWAHPLLKLVRRYCRCRIPERVTARAAADCHWTLGRVYRSRTLTRTSISYLWVSAFPGIEWARSPRELLRYAARRLVPDSETLAGREVNAVIQPRVCGGAWAHMSQTQRILRWVTAPQARTPTLQTVRAALQSVG